MVSSTVSLAFSQEDLFIYPATSVFAFHEHLEMEGILLYKQDEIIIIQ